MKAEKLQVVNDLMEVRKCCLKGIELAEDYIADCDIEKNDNPNHLGDTNVFEGEYYGYLGKFKDGSGSCIRLNGCYVGKQVAKATMQILKNQIALVEDDLEILGVEV